MARPSRVSLPSARCVRERWSIESAGPNVYFMTGVPDDGPILVV